MAVPVTAEAFGVEAQKGANRRVALFLVGLCVVCWSVIPIIATREHLVIDDYQLLALSNVVSAITLLLLAGYQKRLLFVADSSPVKLIELAVIGSIGAYWYYALLFKAYDLSDAKLDVLAMQYTWPVFTVVFARFLSREALSARLLTALAIGFASVILAVLRSGAGRPSFTAASFAIAAALIFGLFSAVSKRRSEDPLGAAAIYFASAALLGLCIAWSRGVPFRLGRGELLIVLINGVLVNGISYVWWLRALSLERAAVVAPLVLATPVLAALLLGLHLHSVAVWTPSSVLAILGVCAAGVLAAR